MTIPTLRCSISPADPASSSTELLVLGPSLGTTSALFSPMVAALRRERPGLRILRFDIPGHGASPVPTEPFTIAEIADAVLRLVDETGGGRFHYAGVSFGGTIGVELALRVPERLLSLAVICSDAKIGSFESWADRAAQVRAQGTPSLVGATPGRWFAEGFIARDPAEASRTLDELSHIDDESYALCCEALGNFDRSADAGTISVRTAVISGEHDPVTTPAALTELAARIPGARYLEVAGASHLAVLERPAEVARILATLTTIEARADSDSAAVIGMRVRREVLGDTHVDAAEERKTPETAAFQEFLTRYAWGDVWNRPGLGRRERSIATLASLITGGHDNEIGMHVRAALTNGLTPAEIAEVIMHTSLYAGLPAANSAFAIARTVFAESGGRISDE